MINLGKQKFMYQGTRDNYVMLVCLSVRVPAASSYPAGDHFIFMEHILPIGLILFSSQAQSPALSRLLKI